MLLLHRSSLTLVSTSVCSPGSDIAELRLLSKEWAELSLPLLPANRVERLQSKQDVMRKMHTPLTNSTPLSAQYPPCPHLGRGASDSCDVMEIFPSRSDSTPVNRTWCPPPRVSRMSPLYNRVLVRPRTSCS